MADTKISDLSSATLVNSTDLLVMVQGGSTVKVDVSTFLSKMPISPIVAQAQESPVSGAISLAVRSSLITSASGATNYTLAAGTHGKIKVIAAPSMGGSATAVVTVTGGSGFTTLTFSALGKSIMLENINGSWFIMGNNGVTVA